MSREFDDTFISSFPDHTITVNSILIETLRNPRDFSLLQQTSSEVEDPCCFEIAWPSVRICKTSRAARYCSSESILKRFHRVLQVRALLVPHTRTLSDRGCFPRLVKSSLRSALRQQLPAGQESNTTFSLFVPMRKEFRESPEKVGISRALLRLAMLHSTHVATRSEPCRRWPLPRIVDQSAARQDASSYDRGSSSAVGCAR